MSRLVFSPKYEPLFRPRTADSPRYWVVTGGRGSGKTTASSTAEVVDTYRDGYTTLYSRATLTSAQVSVIPALSSTVSRTRSMNGMPAAASSTYFSAMDGMSE